MTNKTALTVGLAIGYIALGVVLLGPPAIADIQDRDAKHETDCLRTNATPPHVEADGRFVDEDAAKVQASARCLD